MLRTIFGNFLALIAGAILPLAFAPFGYYPMAIISPAILLFLWLNASARLAFWRGFLYGIGFFGVGVSWVYISIHTYGNASVFLAVLITGSMILFLALYPALQGYLLNRIFPDNNWRKLLLAFPASWVIFEWIRSWFLSGFPWLLLGVAQINSCLKGYMPLVGTYGLSFITIFTAAAVVYILSNNKKHWQRLVILIIPVALWIGGCFLAKVHWTTPVGAKFRVSLLQGNIYQEKKWDPKQLAAILGVYSRLTNASWASSIIVWPEAAVPAFPMEVSLYLKLMSVAAQLHRTAIVYGVPLADRSTGQYYNGILTMGVAHGKYLKRHLVPFGEYLPFKPILSWLHNYFTIPMSGFSSGPKRQAPMIANGILIAPFICYEIAYANIVLSHLPRAQLLVTLCDDSWFGKSIAAAQHLEIARARSLETGRYQLFSTNTGISAIIGPQGEIVAQAPQFKEYVLSADIQAMEGATPWVALGHYFWLLTMLVFLLVATIGIHKHK